MVSDAVIAWIKVDENLNFATNFLYLSNSGHSSLKQIIVVITYTPCAQITTKLKKLYKNICVPLSAKLEQ